MPLQYCFFSLVQARPLRMHAAETGRGNLLRVDTKSSWMLAKLLAPRAYQYCLNYLYKSLCFSDNCLSLLELGGYCLQSFTSSNLTFQPPCGAFRSANMSRS